MIHFLKLNFSPHCPVGSDAAFVSIAGIDLGSPTLVDCFNTKVEAREVLKESAFAEIMWNFFNLEGELVDNELINSSPNIFQNISLALPLNQKKCIYAKFISKIVTS